MDNLVKLLPDNIANQIAAGEVIQRPASVIKELVENAIDAGATEIIINIKDAGKTLIQVIDNGKGMEPIDARMAFERHATSKIRTADDLFALTTMGFRGEALPSIAAVSHVTLQTRTANAEQGIKIHLEGSKVISSEPMACSVGSNFAIKHLFFNTPARRKFLKQDETEFRHITNEVLNIAAVRPDITFILRHNEVTTLEVRPSSLKQRIIDLFGKRFTDTLLPIEIDTPIISIKGYVCTVDATRKRGTQQYFFTNERYMKHSYFHRMVINAYGNMIPKGEYPEYFLYLTVDPSEIDVNISPTKTEIKFAQEQNIGTVIYSTVREALMLGAAVPTLDFTTADTAKIDIPVSNPIDAEQMEEPPLTSDYTRVESKMNQTPHGTKIQLLEDEFKMPDLSDWDTFYERFESKRNNKTNIGGKAKPLIPNTPTAPQEVLPTVPIPWLYDRYALFPEQNGIRVLHIARAKSRLIYHHYYQQIQHGGVVSSRLLFPALIELGARDNSLLQEHLPTLRSMGFDISSMGQNAYTINALPEGINPGTEEDLLLQLLEECHASAKSDIEVITEKLVLKLTSCRVHQGSASMPATEAQSLLIQLLEVPDYQITPDGMKTMTLLSKDELAKLF